MGLGVLRRERVQAVLRLSPERAQPRREPDLQVSHKNPDGDRACEVGDARGGPDGERSPLHARALGEVIETRFRRSWLLIHHRLIKFNVYTHVWAMCVSHIYTRPVRASVLSVCPEIKCFVRNRCV